MRRLLFLIAIAVAISAAPALALDGAIEINQATALKGGVTPSDTPGFPVTIDQSGSYVLTGSLVMPDQNTDGIEITAGNVTVDLNGFEIVGPTSCTGSGSSINCSPTGTGDGVFIAAVKNVTLRDGIIRGAGGAGIQATSSGVDGTQITGLRVSNCGGDGIHAFRVSVSGTHAIENQNIGLRVSAGRVFDSVASGNGSHGIGEIAHSLVTRSMSVLNGGDGIQAYDSVTILGNTILLNEGQGISCVHFINYDASYGQNVIEGNVTGTVDPSCKQLGSNICNGNTTCP